MTELNPLDQRWIDTDSSGYFILKAGIKTMTATEIVDEGF